MKRLFYQTLLILAILTIMLTGCRSKEGSSPNQAGGGGEEGQLTKGQWVELLGNKFGYEAYEGTESYFSDVSPEAGCYSAVQACKEWGILTEENNFFPEDKVTWQYAIETSVRAIGIDKLNQSDINMEITEGNLAEFFTTRIAAVEDSVMEAGLTETDAELILTYAYNYGTGLVLPERFEYVYKEEVKEAEAGSIIANEDGFSAIIHDGSVYEKGDIIYISPSSDSPASALKVSSVDGDKITYEQAVMEEVFEELQVRGTFEAETIIVEAADGITVGLEDGGRQGNIAYASYLETEDRNIETMERKGASCPMVPLGANIKGDTVTFTLPSASGASLTIALSGIKVTADIDYGVFKGLKKADATLSFTDQVTANYEKKDHSSQQYSLGKIKVPLGTTPVTAEFSLIVNMGFDGEVTLTYTSNLVAKANYREGCGFSGSVENQDADCQLHADATVTVEPTIKAEVCCLSRGIVNAKVTSGVVAAGTMDADLLGNEPACLDLIMWVPLRWAINEDGCILTDFIKKAQISKEVWNSENSKIKKHFHYEDMILVDACTRGKGKEVEMTVEEEGGKPFEYNHFNFEEIVFGLIQVSTQAVSLRTGETTQINVISLPSGYRAEELQYTVDDPSICSISGTSVTAARSGVTQIVISTADGKFHTKVSVFVEQEYHDTSGFEPLEV